MPSPNDGDSQYLTKAMYDPQQIVLAMMRKKAAPSFLSGFGG